MALAPRAPAALRAVGKAARALLDAQAPPNLWGESILPALGEIELEMSQAASLQMKLPGQSSLIRSLLSEPHLQHEAAVGSSARPALLERLQMASHGSRQTWPTPDVSEYILRAMVPRPQADDAVPTAQRMYVAVQDEQFRFAVALSVDHNA